MANRTKDIDLGYKEILREIEKLEKKPHVKVGLMGKKIHKESEGLSVVEVGIFNEFGTKNVPERSFMRSTYDERREHWFRRTKRLHRLILKGRSTVEKSLSVMGETIQKDTKNKIIKQDPNWPELSPKTIDKKGSTAKLIDTSQMLNSIRYVVKKR
jgi:hypothetical protein